MLLVILLIVLFVFIFIEIILIHYLKNTPKKKLVNIAFAHEICN